jgi:endo-alpha-1,4-polygalactosaminidase (GH114 family)
VINGIGNEDVFFRGEKDENNSFNPDTDLINVLVEDYKGNGKGVFIIDYVTQAEKKNRLFRECMKRGFVPYAAVRKLDQLPAFPSKE